MLKLRDSIAQSINSTQLTCLMPFKLHDERFPLKFIRSCAFIAIIKNVAIL